jgi:hypothetical protein
MTGLVVDDENPLPWFKELTEIKSWREHILTGTTACPGSSLDQAYEDHQIDSPHNGERSSLTSDVDLISEADTALAQVNDATTSALVGAPKELNEMMDAAVYVDEAINAPIDAAMDASCPRRLHSRVVWVRAVRPGLERHCVDSHAG